MTQDQLVFVARPIPKWQTIISQIFVGVLGVGLVALAFFLDSIAAKFCAAVPGLLFSGLLLRSIIYPPKCVDKLSLDKDQLTVQFHGGVTMTFDVYRDWMNTFVMKQRGTEKRTLFFKNRSGQFGLSPTEFTDSEVLSNLMLRWQTDLQQSENSKKFLEGEQERRLESAKAKRSYLGAKLGFLVAAVAVSAMSWREHDSATAMMFGLIAIVGALIFIKDLWNWRNIGGKSSSVQK